jgi:hypothetical protein
VNGWKSTQFWFAVVVMVAATMLARTSNDYGTVLTGTAWMGLALLVLGAFGIRKIVQHRNDAVSGVNIGWTSTQLWLCLAVVGVATWLASLGVMSGDNWLAVSGTALAMFGIRAAVQHRNDSLAGRPAPPTS